MAGSGSKRVVAVDATIVINLIHVDRLDLLGRLEGWDFIVPEQVAEEVSDPEQSRILAGALASGHLRVEPITEPPEIAIYAELRLTMGRGEAACLALAQERGLTVASDERGRFLRQARGRLGADRIVNTPGILLLAIRQGLLSIDEADRLKEVLERHRFKMKFGSFRDLLEGS